MRNCCNRFGGKGMKKNIGHGEGDEGQRLSVLFLKGKRSGVVFARLYT